MKSVSRLTCVLLALCAPALALAAAPVAPGPERLPADTWVLVTWHGVAEAKKVNRTNPVMKLWNDPQFEAAREQLVALIADEAVEQGSTAGQRRRAIDDVMALLENPVVIGIAGDPLVAMANSGSSNVNLFAVINKKGREAQWKRLNDEANAGSGAEVTRQQFRGVQITKKVKTTAAASQGSLAAQPKVSTSFQATLGDHELFASEQRLMESLISRLQERNPSGDSLLKDPAYQRAQRFRADGAMLEMFVKVPDLSALPIPASPQMNILAVIRELHLERVQGLWLSAGMGRDSTPLKAALIADMTPGSLLDVIAPNVKSFSTLAAAPATGSFGVFRLDLPALYATAMRAVKAGLPPDQGTAVSMMVDSMVAAQTGMRPDQLLGLFTGEIGMVSTGAETLAGGALPSLLMLPVTGGEQVLGLLRTVAAPLFQNEEKIAGATALRVDLPPEQGQTTGTPLYLAVASKMLAFGTDRPMLEGSLTRNAGGAAAPAGSLAADPAFQAVRKSFPAELNGLSYTDIARMPEDILFKAFRSGFEQAQRQARERAEAGNPGDPAAAARARDAEQNIARLQQIFDALPPLIRKHLKVSASGSWKASDGLFIDGFVK